MPAQPAVIVFDVNETLSDMAPMADRFAEIGAPSHLASQWFATLLRDGFALTAAGSAERFAVIGATTLRGVLHGVDIDRDVDAAVEHVMAGFMQLPVHPDVPAGVRALRAAGHRLVTLTNGSTTVAEGLFERAGVRVEFEALMSVEDAGVWKPAKGAYEYAARRCGVDVADLLLVAVHPWDIDGAARAGLSTAWIDRTGTSYPGHFSTPTYTVSALTELPEALAGS
jgi:2-haloacid dehalogenase